MLKIKIAKRKRETRQVITKRVSFAQKSKEERKAALKISIRRAS